MTNITIEERNYLLTNMENLLDEYDYRYDSDALNKIIDELASQKAGLIDAFKKHPNYIEGKFMIAFDADYERKIEPKASMDFWRWIRDFAIPHAYHNGYLPQEVKDKMESYECLPWNIYDFFRYLHNYAERCVSENTAKYLNEICPALHAHAGQKTSRAFNRVCSIYGVDKLPAYNKMFAEYADMVSGLKRKLKFYISLNPLDYLTMSFGNSWSSCHTIDKKNQRGMPNSYQGMHCGGTMSYMLDESSIITYVHTHATEDHEEGKLYRNMFHFNNGTLVQGRVYPQANDGATDLYRTFRRFMQIELTQLLNLNADDWLRRTTSCGENVASYGVHYRDYDHFGGCNVSYPREMPSAASNVVVVGHSRICPWCGHEVSDSEDSGYLHHADCDAINNNDDEPEW